MTPISAEMRTWRFRIFFTTWLSYVGFYFCRKPFNAAKNPIDSHFHWGPETLSHIDAAYLIAYAAGQFLASYMGPKLGVRKNVLIGMLVSIGVTITMGFAQSPWTWGALMILLGLAQATGWSGNVGTVANWFHKHERGRVMGFWSTNFTVGSLASGLILPAVVAHYGGNYQVAFFAGAAVLTVVFLQFFVFQREKPEDVGLAPVDDPVTPVDESKVAEPPLAGFMGLSRRAWFNLLLVAGFYFFAKFVRYAVWSWAPYFLENSYGLSNKAANNYANLFDLCGLPGVYVTGYLSDRFFGSRRSEVALFMMFGMTISSGILYFAANAGMALFVMMLGVTGFMLYGPDALLSGAGAIDIGGRHRAAFAAAVISGFGSSGPVVQTLAIGKLYHKGGSLTPVFAMLFGSAILAMMFCLALVFRNRRGGSGI